MSEFIISAFADEIDSSLEIQMDVLNKYNINHIEIRGVNGRNISEYSLGEVQEIKRRLDERGLSVSAIGSPLGKISITDNFTPHFELFKKMLEMAHILDTRYIRIFSFYLPGDVSPETHRREVMSRLEQMVTEAEKKGIILLHENEKGIYGDTPERCLDIIETINNSFLRVTFDPANFIQCGVEPYPYCYEILKKHIEYMHIKDALIADGSVVPSGYGDGRVRDILIELHKNSFKGFVSLEPHLFHFTGLSQLERNLKQTGDSQSNGEEKFDIAFRALQEILNSIK